MPMPPLVDPVPALRPEEAVRTARHATLAQLGELGQRRIAAARVVVLGAGGLGSPAITALAAAGVGALTVIDDDTVDHSNLQRQFLHRRSDIGQPKTASATRVAAELSPTRVIEQRIRLTEANADDLLRGADVVLDGSDNFATRAVAADACDRLGIALVWGVVQEFHAQVTVFWSEPPTPATAVRLSDLYPPDQVGALPSCAAVGVFGPLCMQTGALMAAEALKLVTGIGEPLLGRIALIDALRGTTATVELRPAVTTTAAVVQEHAPRADPREVDQHEAMRLVAAGARFLDVREPSETASGVIAGSLLLPLGDVLARPQAAGAGPFVVVCRSGIRAARAAAALAGAGVAAAVLAGGIDAWTGTRQDAA